MINPVDMLFLFKPDFQFQKAKIEKKVCLPANEFEEFLRNPLEDMTCIRENIDLMQEDQDEVYHCLLITGEGRRDGVLVESEGYRYARYASYVPDVAALEYDSLSEFGARLSYLADQMISEGTGNTTKGNWIFYFDEIQKQSGLSLSENPELAELLADMIAERPEVSLVSIRGDCLDLCFYLDYCPGCQEEQRKETKQTLADLICASEAADLYLVHKDDVGFVPVGRISRTELDAGKLDAFRDLLQARAGEIRQGAYGKEVELEGVSARRLKELDQFLASFPETIAEQTGPESEKAGTCSCLKDLLDTRWENLHLVHDEIDYGLPHTIVELDAGTLTEAGKEAWADVLNAKVLRVFQGYSGLQMELSGVKASRLDSFSAMLAGYCSEEDYESWVNEPEEEPITPVIQEG